MITIYQIGELNGEDFGFVNLTYELPSENILRGMEEDLHVRARAFTFDDKTEAQLEQEGWMR